MTIWHAWNFDLFQVRYISSLGGYNPSYIVERMLSRILSTALARNFNWAGRGRKMGFIFLINKFYADIF